MRTVWKFPLALNDEWQELEVPESTLAGAQLVAKDPATAWPAVWLEVDTEAPLTNRAFRVFGTGHPIPGDAFHVGSLVDGPYVWHIYERLVL